jgi:hypothetical protein
LNGSDAAGGRGDDDELERLEGCHDFNMALPASKPSEPAMKDPSDCKHLNG